MFKFNFNLETGGINSEDFERKAVEEENKNSDLEWYDAEEVSLDENRHYSNIDLYKLNSTCLAFGDVKMHVIEYERGMKWQQSLVSSIKNADSHHSDLITAVYEGGAKIWECTEDLLKYMLQNNLSDSLCEKLVLDLGCGVGILGIFAAQNKAIVHFQDYNKDVLETITIPNYLINSPFDSEKKTQAKFFAGDWSKYIEAAKKFSKFDIILSSETIYNPDNHKKLLNTFAEKLKPTGVVLLAAKTYYFGVGGGLRQFENLIVADNRFESKVVWVSSIGVCREILEIKLKIV